MSYILNKASYMLTFCHYFDIAFTINPFYLL